MSAEASDKIEPERWNTCLNLLCRPLHDLDAVQRPAALVFHYDGRVQNGGHSSHFDSEDSAHDDDLIHALRAMGAHGQARVLTEARLLNREANETEEDEREPLWKMIGELDRQYHKARPTIEEVLVKYFHEHRDHFP